MAQLLDANVDDLFSFGAVSLRPGGTTTLFSGFGKGAGFGIKPRSQPLGESEPTERKKREDGQVQKYTKDFMMAFAAHYTKIPAPLESSKLEIFIQDESKEGEEDRDWRTRSGPVPQKEEEAKEEAKEEGGKKGGKKSSKASNKASDGDRWTSQGQPQERAVQMEKDDPALKIQKASDLGRQAWMPGQATAAGQELNLKSVKGILNKLTPEKFERLLGQMVEKVTSAEVLKGSITYIFENAVAQPTFVQMYAELCHQLSERLPEYPPAEGETKPQTFRRILLNTCQEEYEGAVNARNKLDEVKDPDERMVEEKKVKSRMLGNVRLIAHLHRIKVVNEKIIHLCVRELLGDDAKQIPLEDNIEAVCEIIEIVGATLQGSPQALTRKALEGYMARLEKLGKSKSVSNRVRFLIRDIQDMKSNNWVPRREKMTAKKLSEVHSEAQAELGMVLPGLQTNVNLPSLNLPPMAVGQRAAEDAELLPSNFKGADDGWEFVGKGSKKNTVLDMAGKQMTSAFVGEYIPMPNRAAPAAASGVKLTPEKMEERVKSLLKEYVGVFDIGEALLCIKELNAPEFMPKAVEIGLTVLFDCTRDKEHVAMVDLLVALCSRNACTKEDLLAGLGKYTSQLEDLKLDIPMAPKLLGMFLAKAMVEGCLGMDSLRDACNANADTGAETKRALSEETFKALRAAGGDLAKLAADGGVKGSDFLQADPEIDPEDLPSVADWLSQKGFSAFPA